MMYDFRILFPFIFWLSVGMILYTYAGYPLLVAGLAQLRRKPVPREVPLPSITLLIAAYNEEAVIAHKLDNALAINYPPDKLQVIVAADGSDDSTAEIVKNYADQGVELSYHPQRGGKMAAINRAMENAQGEIIVFSDANNLYTANALRALAAPFSSQDVGGVVGAKKVFSGGSPVGESESLYWRYEAFLKEHETRLGCCTAAAGEIFAMRRVLFKRPPEGIINDDFYLMAKIIRRGFNVVYAPEAQSYESVSLSAEDEIQRRARIVAGRYQAMRLAHKLLPWKRPLVTWQMVSHKFLRPLVPLAMMGCFAAALAAVFFPPPQGIPLFSLRPPWGWVMLAGQGLFYFMAWAGRGIQISHPAGKMLYLPKFLLDSNLAALIGLYRFLFGKQTPLWQKAKRRDEQEPLRIEDIP